MKKCHSIREKKSDIFPPFAVHLCAIALQNPAFGLRQNRKRLLKNEIARKNT